MSALDGWPNDGWVDASADALDLGDFTGVVQVAVPGAPGGEFRYHRTFEKGRVTGGGVGPAPDPAVSLTLPVAEARSVLAGELDPSVAFMQGRLKTAGDNGLLLELLAGWSSPAGRASLVRMREVAE